MCNVDNSLATEMASAIVFIPKVHQVIDKDEQVAFLRRIPTAHLVTVLAGVPTATRLPVLVEERTQDNGTVVVVRGHLAKANPQARSVGATEHALMIFDGPQGYVSPRCYSEKQLTGKVVPTWNYATAHVTGKLLLLNAYQAKLDLVSDLSDFHESGLTDPWSVDDAPADYVEKSMRSIVGVELHVHLIELSLKLSQNKDAEDYGRVASSFERSDSAEDVELGKLMNSQIPQAGDSNARN